MEEVFTKVVTLLSQMVDMFPAQVMNYLLVLEIFYMNYLLVLENFDLKSEFKSAFICVGKYCFRFS